MNDTIYIICICFLIILCCLLSYKLYKFSIIILNMEESLEASLDILDKKYRSINVILKKPVFFDSIEVRTVMGDIKDCHAAILEIANKLTNDAGIESEIKKESWETKSKAP